MRQAFGAGYARWFPWRLRAAFIFALAVGLVLGAALPCEARGRGQRVASLPSTEQLPVLRHTRAIWAWSSFCERYPRECAVEAGEPELMILTRATWETINNVNRRVNAALKPMSDSEHWSVEDRWDLGEDGYGDCEDYQLLKRKLLAGKGLPRRAMRLTVVLDEKGEGHAVLMVRTDRGDFILDNKTNFVLAWDQTSYTFVKREAADGTSWVSLGGVVPPFATANR
jgi:predicted transglutaminase-like cysteine proteinase